VKALETRNTDQLEINQRLSDKVERLESKVNSLEEEVQSQKEYIAAMRSNTRAFMNDP
jgi:chaperonin cofactor prefoldin